MASIPFVATSTGDAEDAPAGSIPVALYGAGGGDEPTTVTWANVTGKPSTFAPTIGTTATTAKAGNYQPTAADISDSTAVGRSVLTATDAAAGRTALGLGSLATVSTVTSANITDGTIVNADISATAAIAATKIAVAADATNGVDAGTLQAVISALAARITALEPAGE